MLLSAGVGVTPFIAMLESRAAKAEAAAAGQACPASAHAPLHFIHGTNTPHTEAFPALVRSLSAKGTISADVFYTRTPADALASQTTAGTRVHAARITPQWVKANTPADALYYICGPESFMQDMIAGLRAAGIPDDRLRREIFGSAITLDDALNAA